MALRLELDFDKKKEPTPVLDLSKFKINSRQDFDKACEKVPDYKIKPEKVRFEDVKIQDTHFSFAPTRAEVIAGREAASGGIATGTTEFPFGNPVPPSMRGVRIEDLSSVDINWRMLTLARPKTKLEEDIFSRFVSLDKMKRKTRQAEGDQVPPQRQIVQSKGAKGGKGSKGPARASGAGGAVPETRFPSCKECGDELCTGGCKDFHYDAAERIILEEKEKEGDKQEGLNLSALLDGTGGGSSRKKKAHASTKGGPPRMSFKRKKKKSTGKKKSTAKNPDNDEDVNRTVISGTTVLPKAPRADDTSDEEAGKEAARSKPKRVGRRKATVKAAA